MFIMDRTIIKKCPKHGLTEYVLQTNGSYKCKECRKEAVIDIRRRNKIKLVEYKGGKCERCGYNKCIEALEFHHLNPDEKDFGVSCGSTRSLKKLKTEVDKCIMVCANCHREIHAEERERQILEREKNKIDNEVTFFEEQGFSKEYHQSRKLINEKLKLEEIKKDINNNLPKTKIAEKYGVGLTTLRRFLQKNGINYVEVKKNVTGNLSKDDFLCVFKKIGTFTKVGEYFGVSDNALRRWCERQNLPWRKKELVDYINRLYK